MNHYELTICFPGSLSSAKKKAQVAKIEKLIKTLKGKIIKLDDWGEIDLAYKIAKNDTGNFLLFNLELGSSEAKSVSEKLKLEEGIIRYLLVRKDK